MATTIGPVTPATVERPKRIAKALDRIFPNQKLAKCQAVTAKLYGFQDWHALEEAIKSGTILGPFDEELSPEQLEKRRGAQMEILARQLAGIELKQDYPPPENRSDPLDQFGEKRMAQAHKRLLQVMSVDAVCELRPTRRSHPPTNDPIDELNLAKSDEFASLPEKLSRWWSVNIPYQPEAGKALEDHSMDVRSATSILGFASHWGTLCMFYAGTISWGMLMGTAHILAEGYSAACLPYGEAWMEFVVQSKAAPEMSRALIDKLKQEKHEAEARFYACYPRDDLLEAWLAQPEAFKKNAQDVQKILANPRSKKGTWK